MLDLKGASQSTTYAMEVPSDLLNQVRESGAVLFLGAGASSHTVTKDGRRGLTATELGQLLSDKFLGGYLSHS